HGLGIDDVHACCRFDPWFLEQIRDIVAAESELRADGLPPAAEGLQRLKSLGFCDARLAELTGLTEQAVTARRRALAIAPVYKRIDTCAAEIPSTTPYMYSTYEGDGRTPAESEAEPSARRKVIILGGGPNRIGQGIEFDYCCVHAVYALGDAGFETIMINCNPETVSTDYDTADRLYFEPLTAEDVIEIVRVEQARGNLAGVILQFGGQTPLKLAIPLMKAGVPIIGTSPDNIDRAEDRKRFKEVLETLGLKQPTSGIATSFAEAKKIAARIGYPVMVRPSYVLGGRAMEIVYDQHRLEYYMEHAVEASPEHPILIDDFLEKATEVDVDAISDGTDVVIGGVMEHIEEAGIHSGDSACSLPAFSLEPKIIETIKEQTCQLARELNVIGLLNIQFAVKDGDVYILEVNPRASRTIPFVSKTTGVPLAKLAARVMAGKTLKELGFTREVTVSHIAVKESVFPFNKFDKVDILLGPEMKSTGEVMGIDRTFGMAFAKAQLATGIRFPDEGVAFISVKDGDKPEALQIAKSFSELGYSIVATRGTARFLNDHGLAAACINKVKEGSPHIVAEIESGGIQFVVNTVFGEQSIKDSFSLRRASLNHNLPYYTTIAGAFALLTALRELRENEMTVTALQDYGIT
ncbi:MAG: carbamoyl-phosphate synthase large subunit, partial [Nitrospinae bacterium]|nr:carbamoyl-phosphate synthase large subunit [Nitrospinota bacterium]